jgi:hypothetical protein
MAGNRRAYDPGVAGGRGRNEAHVDVRSCDPETAFAMITDLDALASWNDQIAEVVERPPALAPGAIWKVRMQQGPMRWVSRSTVIELDADRHVFVHRSGTDDDNPSWSEWRWRVLPAGDGSRIEVGWTLHPRTRLRRLLLAPYRSRRLRREVPVSLERLAAVLQRS